MPFSANRLPSWDLASCKSGCDPLKSVQVNPTHVLNAAGLTGRPNVDWCESHKVCKALLASLAHVYPITQSTTVG